MNGTVQISARTYRNGKSMRRQSRGRAVRVYVPVHVMTPCNRLKETVKKNRACVGMRYEIRVCYAAIDWGASAAVASPFHSFDYWGASLDTVFRNESMTLQ